MDTMNGVRQRVAMATGGKMADGEFGVKSWDCQHGKSMGSMAVAKSGSDNDRGAAKPVKYSSAKMPAQSAPDHGSHKK